MSRNHPYREIADFQRWNRAVSWAPPGALDPVVDTRFTVARSDRIATMGSCFAQHLSRHLAASGFEYLVAEPGPEGHADAERRRRQYGTFSARYGNVYTVEQAVQLFGRAYGAFVPAETAWTRDDGRFVDPFRPLVEPEGFATADDLEADRGRHLTATRSVFEDSDVLVFTLGLTEAWRSRDDGTVYPSAPGVNGGSFDDAAHEFVNFDVDEVRRGLFEFCELVRSVNPTVRILLTVSPVPLIATAVPRHVLVSTAYSKAVLRIAAQAAYDRFELVDYFPSYEIITAAGVRNYYEPDLREVRPAGVAHVMRVFSRHYVDGADWEASPSPPAGQYAAPVDPVSVVCDEETIEAAIRATGPT